MCKLILIALDTKAYSSKELAHHAGINVDTARHWMKILSDDSNPKSPNVVYIAEWVRAGRSHNKVARYALGVGIPHAPKNHSREY